MKPKINEVTVKYIECDECGCERSFLLSGTFKWGNFSWYCPQCNCRWSGVLEKDGAVSVEKGDRNESPRYVLIEMSGGLNPLVIQAAGGETADNKETRAMERAPTTLLLNAVEPDAENNPRGFAQYKAQDF